MLNIPEIESHIQDLRQNQERMASHIEMLAQDLRELRDQLQVAPSPKDAVPTSPLMNAKNAAGIGRGY